MAYLVFPQTLKNLIFPNKKQFMFMKTFVFHGVEGRWYMVEGRMNPNGLKGVLDTLNSRVILASKHWRKEVRNPSTIFPMNRLPMWCFADVAKQGHPTTVGVKTENWVCRSMHRHDVLIDAGVQSDWIGQTQNKKHCLFGGNMQKCSCLCYPLPGYKLASISTLSKQEHLCPHV